MPLTSAVGGKELGLKRKFRNIGRTNIKMKSELLADGIAPGGT